MNKIVYIIIAVLITSLISCKKTKNETNEGVSLNCTKSKFDSLANREISSKRMNAELLWKFGRLWGSRLSPDAKSVLYMVKRYNSKTNNGYTDIFKLSVENGEVNKLTDFYGTEWNARWSKDGEEIYFLATESGSGQIWKMNKDGSNKVQLSEIENGINSFELSPDENHLFYTSEVKLDKNCNDIYKDLPKANARIINDLMYRHWNTWHDYKYSHIFVSEIKEDKIENGKDIMKNERWDAPLSPYFDYSEMCWGPDGKRIAYTCKKLTGKEYAVSTNSDIYIYNIDEDKTINITKEMPGYDKYPAFSPNGKMIAWQSMETPGYESDKDRLFMMDFETKEKQYITKDFDRNASGLLWDDNKNIYFISGINATYQLYKVNIENKKIAQITKGKHNYTSFDKKADVIIGNKTTMAMATEIFKISENGEEKQLSSVNKNIYDKVEMGKSEERWVTTTDGKKMLVWVIYPPNFDKNKKYPALLYCQGGPQSAVSQFWSYRWNFQMMAAHDYIIVAPNRRGLPTFGEEWNVQISGDYGGQNMKDYLSAIDELKKEAFIDENRLGAVGASYGGFSVFWLAGHHNNRFSAFISHCGMFNLESQYAATEEMFFVNHDLGGPYWDKSNKIAQKSYANSPHKFVQNWDTPIMIITGENDFRIPYTESLQAFNAAQLVGVESKLLIFPDETHFVLKPQNSILWQREFFKFLDKYLK